MAFNDPEAILRDAATKQVIKTEKAPEAIGPYSQAVRAGEFVYASGQIPIDPKTGNFSSDDIREQAKQSLENLKAILEAANYALDDVIKTTVFVTDIANFSAVNEVYAKYFAKDAPARSFVAVKDLPKGAKVEIEAVAWKKF